MSILSVKLSVRLRRAAARMRAEQNRASAIIEFALIAPVFFILLLGIVENGLIYFAGSTLQYATDNAARYIRTGQASSASMTQTQFRNMICGDISPLLACNSNLQIDVQAYTSYSNASYSTPTDSSGNLKTSLNNFQIGSACSVVLVRSFYVWHVITPVLSPFLTNMTTGNHLITATAAFRNEPFTSAVSGC
ncbi:MAG: pilus assembly protein [Proteobacteria bacterium]|nr:pilus assembly protein [Pseudomonadota bacterium]